MTTPKKALDIYNQFLRERPFTVLTLNNEDRAYKFVEWLHKRPFLKAEVTEALKDVEC